MARPCCGSESDVMWPLDDLPGLPAPPRFVGSALTSAVGQEFRHSTLAVAERGLERRHAHAVWPIDGRTLLEKNLRLEYQAVISGTLKRVGEVYFPVNGAEWRSRRRNGS